MKETYVLRNCVFVSVLAHKQNVLRFELIYVFVLSAGTFRGVCKKIDHFPEDADYEADAAEYLLRKSPSTELHQTLKYMFLHLK